MSKPADAAYKGTRTVLRQVAHIKTRKGHCQRGRDPQSALGDVGGVPLSDLVHGLFHRLPCCGLWLQHSLPKRLVRHLLPSAGMGEGPVCCD